MTGTLDGRRPSTYAWTVSPVGIGPGGCGGLRSDVRGAHAQSRPDAGRARDRANPTRPWWACSVYGGRGSSSRTFLRHGPWCEHPYMTTRVLRVRAISSRRLWVGRRGRFVRAVVVGQPRCTRRTYPTLSRSPVCLAMRVAYHTHGPRSVIDRPHAGDVSVRPHSIDGGS